MPPPAFLQGLLNSYPAELLGKAARSPLGQGIGRALVPLAIGGIAQAFAPTRAKGRVFAPYLGLGTQQILGALDQPQREQQQLFSLLGQMGQLSSTAPTSGASPVGSLAGQPFFRDTRTLQEANPGLFPESISPESRVQFQKLAQPPLAQGALPPLAPAPPQSPYDRALGVIGAQPNSARGQGALAELLLKQGIAEQEARQRKEGLETLTQLGQQQQGGQGQPRLRYGLDARGNITASVLPPPAERAPGLLEQYGTPEELRAYARDRLTRRPEPRQERQPRAPSRYDRLDQLLATGQISREQYNQAVVGGGGSDPLMKFLFTESVRNQLEGLDKQEEDLRKENAKTQEELETFRPFIGGITAPEEMDSFDVSKLPGAANADPKRLEAQRQRVKGLLRSLQKNPQDLARLQERKQRLFEGAAELTGSPGAAIPSAAAPSAAAPPAEPKAKGKAKAPTKEKPAPAGSGEFDFDPTTGGLVPRR